MINPTSSNLMLRQRARSWAGTLREDWRAKGHGRPTSDEEVISITIGTSAYGCKLAIQRSHE